MLSDASGKLRTNNLIAPVAVFWPKPLPNILLKTLLSSQIYPVHGELALSVDV